MGKLIFLDIDGTITMPGIPPSGATVEAVRAARANGHKVFLSTGRLESCVEEKVRAIGFDGGIFSAGGRVVVDGTVLADLPVPSGLARRVTDVLRREGVPYMAETDRGILTAEGEILQGPEALMGAIRGVFLPEGEKIEPNEPVRIYKLLIKAPTAEKARRLETCLGGIAKVVFFRELAPGATMIFGEIADPGIHKGAALERVCQYLRADKQDTVAFGDSMNDAEIIEAAGLGVAMGNAGENVKELADMVCGRCEEDGLARAFADLKFI